MPKVSVLMSVYNAEVYLREAIDSVLNQSFEDFEFIIVNDGSTDGSEDIISSYNDERIIYVNNVVNHGLIYSLNTGLNIAKGKYLARMDADDICYPERLGIQYDFMENNRNVTVCGSNAHYFGDGIQEYLRIMPANKKSIGVYSLFKCPFIHPTVFIRLDGFHYRYEPFFVGAEDYALWQDVIKNHDLHNIQKALIKYRIVANSVTRVEQKKVLNRFEVLKSILNKHYASGDLSEGSLSTLTVLSSKLFMNEIHIDMSDLESLRKEITGIRLDDGYLPLFRERYFIFLFYNRIIKFNSDYVIGFIYTCKRVLYRKLLKIDY
jgi:glycosyltransferase involved in cell wall biosynthesis